MRVGGWAGACLAWSHSSRCAWLQKRASTLVHSCPLHCPLYPPCRNAPCRTAPHVPPHPEVHDVLDLYRRVYEELLAVPVTKVGAGACAGALCFGRCGSVQRRWMVVGVEGRGHKLEAAC